MGTDKVTDADSVKEIDKVMDIDKMMNTDKMTDTDELYWYWLCNIEGIGNKKQKRLLDCFRSPKQIYKAGTGELMQVKGIGKKDADNIIASRREENYYKSYLTMKKKGISFIYIEHPAYPSRLKMLYDAPIGLYYKGRLPDEKRRSVAIVGARNCTPYGKSVAAEFAAVFAKMGIQVISGMAAGVDTAGHSGCLKAGGYTCAVLGCGADICYPRNNIQIYTEIAQKGCILSEYAVGTPPAAGQFPPRNRIISGLADAVIVVEAREKSGSLITVDQALEQNKEVMAVPGRLGDELSKGCNELIKQGAQMVTSPEDVLACLAAVKQPQQDDWNWQPESMDISAQKSKSGTNLLASAKNMVYSLLNLYPKSLDTIIEETGMDIMAVSEALLALQLEGRVQEVSKNCYTRVYI